MIPVPLTTLTAAAETAPAGGAAAWQVIAVTAFVTVGFTALVVLGEMHRRGRRTPLGTIAAFASRLSGLPVWAALPLGVAGVALSTALFGYMWDAALHIDRGRDDGPLANPSHYLILGGLYGITAAGYLSSVLVKPGEKPGRSALRITDDWYVPLGAVLISAAALFAFAGFPLDDVWHRLFGQDVTLWGPTHLVMLGGGMMTLVGVVILFEEGVASARHRESGGTRKPSKNLIARVADLIPAIPLWPTRALIAGGFLGGLSIFQGEFDYGVPQFQLVLQPLLIAVSAGIALVAARLWIGRGGALGAVAFYLLIRGVVSLLVGPVFGETTPSAPLYVAEAACVELAALFFARRPLVMGAVAGLAIGTIGFAAEWAWIGVAMPIEWTEALLPEGLILAALGGIFGGVIGSLFGLALRRENPLPARAGAIAAGSLAAVMACFAFGLADRNPSGAEAQVTLTEVKGAPEREVIANVRFDPPEIADGASWVRGIAWQGGGLVGFDFERVGEGLYRATEPLPAHGTWKAGIRIQNGHSVIGVPIYSPADEAIPLPEVPARAAFTRPFEPDRELLQRERDPDVAPWIWFAASLSVLLMALAFFSVLAWGMARFARGGPAEPSSPRARPFSGIPATGAGA